MVIKMWFLDRKDLVMKHRSSLIVIAMLLEEGKRCANIMSVYLVFIPSNLVRLALIFRLLCNVTNSFFCPASDVNTDFPSYTFHNTYILYVTLSLISVLQVTLSQLFLSNFVMSALIFCLLCNVTNSFSVLQVTLTQTFRPTCFITLSSFM